jgi:hypothetical protein
MNKLRPLGKWEETGQHPRTRKRRGELLCLTASSLRPCTVVYYVRDPMCVGVGQMDLHLSWWVALS